ncbi:hypothetical protein [Candidatus Cryosericum odellii]
MFGLSFYYTLPWYGLPREYLIVISVRHF